MLSDTVSKLLDRLGDEAKENFISETELDFHFGKIESPIEQIFWIYWKSFLGQKKEPKILPQYPIDRYSVDFYIPSINTVVELKGHEWHERHPAQVEKDNIRERFIQDQGFTLIRFSGREILRNGEALIQKLYDKAVN